MPTFTIELDDKRLATLEPRAKEAGTTAEELARELLEDFTEEPSDDVFTPEQRAAVQAGMAAIERGNVVRQEKVFAKLEARYRK